MEHPPILLLLAAKLTELQPYLASIPTDEGIRVDLPLTVKETEDLHEWVQSTVNPHLSETRPILYACDREAAVGALTDFLIAHPGQRWG
jgi:hypothetical protein